jgi:hypothetical protein
LSRAGRLNFLPHFDEWMTSPHRLSSGTMPSEMSLLWRMRLLNAAQAGGTQATEIVA